MIPRMYLYLAELSLCREFGHANVTCDKTSKKILVSDPEDDSYIITFSQVGDQTIEGTDKFGKTFSVPLIVINELTFLKKPSFTEELTQALV